ncbi:MAG: hypothetical protein HZA09_01815 [Nitrospirae bacterium]|nr:hypothetical protein [Nitrospirota bacterium]
MAKRFIKKLENIFIAITFAESGEFETAREILKASKEDSEIRHKEKVRDVSVFASGFNKH